MSAISCDTISPQLGLNLFFFLSIKFDHRTISGSPEPLLTFFSSIHSYVNAVKYLYMKIPKLQEGDDCLSYFCHINLFSVVINGTVKLRVIRIHFPPSQKYSAHHMISDHSLALTLSDSHCRGAHGTKINGI